MQWPNLVLLVVLGLFPVGSIQTQVSSRRYIGFRDVNWTVVLHTGSSFRWRLKMACVIHHVHVLHTLNIQLNIREHFSSK